MTVLSRAAKINRLVKGLNINEDAATVDVIFRITGNQQLRRDQIQKRIKEWDPFSEVSFDGDKVKYRGSNWNAVWTQLKLLGYNITHGGVQESLEDEVTDPSVDNEKMVDSIHEIVQDHELSDEDKVNRIGELVVAQIECRKSKM